jgi:hypothetical protein
MVFRDQKEKEKMYAKRVDKKLDVFNFLTEERNVKKKCDTARRKDHE